MFEIIRLEFLIKFLSPLCYQSRKTLNIMSFVLLNIDI